MTKPPNSKTKIPPNSKESEMMVLGSMLTNINSLNIASDNLDEHDFYYGEHKIIFQSLKKAYLNDRPADIHLIAEELKREDKLQEIGGINYLVSLAQYAGVSAYIEEYTEIVKNKSVLRRMILAAQEVEKDAILDPSDVHTVLDTAQQKFFEISQAANPNVGTSIEELIIGANTHAKKHYLEALQQKQEEYRQRGPNELSITGIPTHFMDLDKMIGGFSPSNLMILAARPAMGKCVTGDTLILNPKTGALEPIRELVKNRSAAIVTLGKDWKLQETTPSAYVADGIKPTFKITTALGKELEATAVHPLLTINGWKRVEELKAGDRIAVPRELPYFGTEEWPEHHLKVLAYLIADGTLVKSQPGFTNTNPKLVADFKNAALAFGSIRIRKESYKEKAPTYFPALDRTELNSTKKHFSEALQSLSISRKKALHQITRDFDLSPANVYAWTKGENLPSHNISIALDIEIPELPSLIELVRENPITAFLKNLGLMNKDSHEKFLPKKLFELKKGNLALFINRLFSCDGTAYVANCGGRPFPVIAYSSVSKELIYQLQHLLLRFSILSKIRKKRTKCNDKIFPSFELEIHGHDDLIRFCQEIGIYGKEKAVAAVLKQVQKTPAGWTKDTLPIEIWDLIRQKKGDRSWSSLFINKQLPPPSNIHEGKRSIRRDTLAKIAHVLDDEELKQISESDVYWDRITSIESTGEKEVFDLSVDQTHNFVAGDIIVHNTALALNIAEHVCFKNSVPVGIFSLEMTADQLLHRIICSQSEVESDKIKTGSLNGSEYQRIVAAVNYMQSHVMVIDDTPGIKITDLRARARRMKETHKIGFLVIDYLQLLSGSGSVRSVENRQNEISEISRMLKILARELNIPILCLSQLSRKVEERQGHRPMMSDLRESGCLAGDTLIKDAETGQLYTIKELAERKEQTPIKVFAVDQELKLGVHTLSKAFYSGKKKVYEIKTATGRTIKASANHPFLKLEGWTRLDLLKVNDKIGTPQSAQSIDFSINRCISQTVITGNTVLKNDLISLGLSESGVYWDKIVSITEIGEEDVYDATVPGVHNFVANDFIVHNSLEQDSDLVMFLLRREYYDPYDKPGLAELIVAKNRHGGIGNITLTFRKEFAQFANYTRSEAKAGAQTSNDAFAAFSPD